MLFTTRSSFLLLCICIIYSWYSVSSTSKKISPHKIHTTPKNPFADINCINLPGIWTGFSNNRPLYDEYDLQFPDNPPTNGFVSIMIRGGGWSLGKGTLGPDNQTAIIAFDSNVLLHGNVTDNCTTISWDNNTQWKKKSGIDVVHIVFMNHLDIGYNGIPGVGFINNIMNVYFNIYFPRALGIAQAMRDVGGEERFIYTTHPFLLHLYLHCDEFVLAGVKLDCPTQQEQENMRNAVKRGDVYWHASMANMEYGNVYSAEMVEATLLFNQLLALELGVPPSKTVSIRDVPGTVRSIIPTLIKQNITAITIGVNNYSPAPLMPSPGVWREPATNTRILYMQTPQGAGYPDTPGTSPTDPGGMSSSHCVTYPGFSHVLCWAFRTDNSGPPGSVDEVLTNFDIARWQFPGSKVYASTYENFTEQLATIIDQLPETTAESGETWIVSDTADPVKMAYYRTVSRVYIDCLNSGQCDPLTDSRISLFLRMLLKIPEHTYGLPTIEDNKNYTNEQFHAARAAGLQTYINSENSWQEQRDIAMRVGFGYLQDHPLAKAISSVIPALQPVVPDPTKSGLVSVPESQWSKTYTVTSGGSPITLGLDPSTGALSTLIMKSVSWASSNHLLGKFIYRTYNDTDVSEQHAIKDCCCCWGWQNMQQVANPQQQIVSPKISALYSSPFSGPVITAPFTLLAQLTFTSPSFHLNYGAPSIVWLNYTVTTTSSISIELQLFNKTSTRLGEALFFDFTQNPQTNGNWKWFVDVLGLPVDPLDVITNGGVHQHGVKEGVYYAQQSGTGKLVIDTIDAAVVSPHTTVNEATSMLAPLTPLSGTVTGFSVILFQNAFNTNVPLYSVDPSWKFRFMISSTQ